jgi:Ca2+-dependent lipid-binding protein
MVSSIVDDLKQQITLFISARNLKDLDYLSKTDPFCEVQEYINDKWVFNAKTEMQRDNLNPDFKTGIKLDYYFEKLQKLRFVIKDYDN